MLYPLEGGNIVPPLIFNGDFEFTKTLNEMLSNCVIVRIGVMNNPGDGYEGGGLGIEYKAKDGTLKAIILEFNENGIWFPRN